MKFKKLGTTDLNVSLICLGTMTWGTQNSEKDAFEQMDYSVSEGINFFDTAEIYSVPPTAESYRQMFEQPIPAKLNVTALNICKVLDDSEMKQSVTICDTHDVKLVQQQFADITKDEVISC